MARNIKKEKLILVEGPVDQRFFRAFLDYHDDFDDSEIQVMHVGGKDEFGSELNVITKMDKFRDVEKLAIFRDSHDDPDETFEATKNILAGLGLPYSDNPTRVVGGGRDPRVIIGLIPNPDQEGEIEDLCLQSVSDDPAIDCIYEFFNCLNSDGVPTPRKMNKARAQIFIASREDHCRDFREACDYRHWDYEDEAFEYLKTCLDLIF